VCPVLNHIRDGQHQSRITKGVNYWPNRFNAIPPTDPDKGGYHEYAQKLHGMKLRTRAPKFQEHYNQTELFYNSLSPVEKKHLIDAISFELSHCDDPLVYNNAIPQLERGRPRAGQGGGDQRRSRRTPKAETQEPREEDHPDLSDGFHAGEAVDQVEEDRDPRRGRFRGGCCRRAEGCDEVGICFYVHHWT
jgi:hypothetical protein